MKINFIEYDPQDGSEYNASAFPSDGLFISLPKQCIYSVGNNRGMVFQAPLLPGWRDATAKEDEKKEVSPAAGSFSEASVLKLAALLRNSAEVPVDQILAIKIP